MGTVLEGKHFDDAMALLLVWFLAGIFMDGRSHLHDAPITFFTPEHAFFYTAFTVMAGMIALKTYVVYRSSGSFRKSFPEGYRFAAVGVLLFGSGGIGDMLWHGTFGIETSIEALYSPTHLMLAAGAVLLASGPLQSFMKRNGGSGWREQLPALVSAGGMLSLVTFMTMYAHPVVRPLAAEGYTQMVSGTSLPFYGAVQIGMLSILVQGAVLAGLLLWLRSLVDPVPGGLLFVVGMNMVLMAFLEGMYYLLPGVLAGGLAMEVVLHRLGDTPREVLVAGFVIPFLIFTGYFAAVAFFRGIAWSVHLWAGAPVLGGIAGLLAGFLFVARPRE